MSGRDDLVSDVTGMTKILYPVLADGGSDATGPAPEPAPCLQIALPARKRRRGLYVRHVTRMTGQLNAAMLRAAHKEGLTGSAWVRGLILDRIGMQSEEDSRSGRPVRNPDADHAAIAAAIRELAAVSAAVQLADTDGAKAGLDRARHLLIPIVVARPAF